MNNFLASQQSGINTSHALGLNYSDNWGKKWKVSGSYFFNGINSNKEANWPALLYYPRPKGNFMRRIIFFQQQCQPPLQCTARIYAQHQELFYHYTPRLSLQDMFALE
ncbi:MAG: hypothetical protein R2822_31585 [Spirosomataceae bacterium]